MARLPRKIRTDTDGKYHLRGQAAGRIGFYPFHNRENAAQLFTTIRRYTSLFFCQVTSLTILGNHYHLVCRFQAFRKLTREQLWEIAVRFYPDPGYQPYLKWRDADWERFNRRLFNVSELMRNIQSGYARWYNRRHHRKGRFWADRFQSTESDNLIETTFYVELNPVRAYLVKQPENWRLSSAWFRKRGQDDWLMSLTELMGVPDPKLAEQLFWTLLYWRGTKPSKQGDARIPVEMALAMEKANFPRGCYLKKIPAFGRGKVVGSRETVQQALDDCLERGIRQRESQPVPLGIGDLYALREQRSNFVEI